MTTVIVGACFPVVLRTIRGGWSREVAIGVDGNALSARPLSLPCFRAWTLGGESFIDKSRGSAREREHRPTSMLGGKSGRNLAIPFIYLEDIKRN